MDAQVSELGSHRGEREKKRVAGASVIAAVFLTSMKLVVGLMTGSLGILSEAAHSALDLAAAGVTLFAVRASAKPADRDHTYGHGKIENLSALFETLLLLLTCVWIIYEAIQRLFFKQVEVEASVWAFLVMFISIAVDLSRSRALLRVAEKYNSQALEADALHFSTDIWSSTVVIVGLILVRLSDLLGFEWLVKADAAAAIGVAIIVTYVSVRLGMRTIATLLDAVPADVRDRVAEAANVEGVSQVKRVRVRTVGPETFADLTLLVDNRITFEGAHEIADQVEAAVRQILPGADVVVHLEPVGHGKNGYIDAIQDLAAKHGIKAHEIRLYNLADGQLLEMHLELSDSLTVDEAHAKASAFEADLGRVLPHVDRVITHLEPLIGQQLRGGGTRADKVQVLRVLKDLERDHGLACDFHQVEVLRVTDKLFVSFHCTVDPTTGIVDAHSITERLERELHSKLPDLDRVVIHIEPTDAPAP